MKKSMLFLVAVCVLLVSAQSSFARTYEDNLPYCENWEGKWSIVTNHGTDNVTIDAICKKDEGCLLGTAALFWCQATGKREVDNQTILIAQVSMDPNGYGYYEIDNTTVLGSSTPYDSIPISGINLICGTFSGEPGLNVTDDFGLRSGKKFGTPDNCSEDNETCELAKVIPAKISKLLAIAQPIKPFVIIGSGDPAFVKGDKAAFDTDAIKPLIQLRISAKIIIAIAFVNPFALTAGDVEVSVGDCITTIVVK